MTTMKTRDVTVGMKETFLLNEFLTPANVVHLVRERLDWMDECCEVRFEG
jgi:hypothetical protein